MNINEKINSNPDVKDFFAKFDGFRFDFLEHSIKITKSDVLENRFLLGENRNKNSKLNLIKILSKLTTNQLIIKASIDSMLQSDRYGFAIEIGNTVNYRIYFETEMTPYRKKVVSEDSRDRTTAITAFRWNQNEDRNVVITTYDQLLENDKDKIKSELKKLEIKYLPEYFDNYDILRFYVVSENKTKRNSLAFQLKNFDISNIENSLVELNPNSKRIIDEYSKKFCGNISYGFDKNQNLFHTFYFTLYNNVYTQKRSAR